MTVVRPEMKYPVLLGNPDVKYERMMIGDRALRRNYIVADADKTEDRDVGRECGSEAVNLKIERDQNSLFDPSTYEPTTKKKD